MFRAGETRTGRVASGRVVSRLVVSRLTKIDPYTTTRYRQNCLYKNTVVGLAKAVLAITIYVRRNLVSSSITSTITYELIIPSFCISCFGL